MLGNYVAGAWVAGDEAHALPIVNPANEELLATVSTATADVVDGAVAAAAEAFAGWARQSPSARARAVLHLADLLDANTDELARLESANVGKPLEGAVEEMEFTADALRFIAGAARTMDGQVAAEYVPGHTSLTRRDPIGVTAEICPWNYPLHIALVKACQAIAVGNTVVLKPSELTPLTLLRFMDLAEGVLPAGVLNVVNGEGVPVGEQLVAHPTVGAVGFTGDVATGRAIAANAAGRVKRLSLELGGKSPVVVFADADLAAVAEMLRVGAFANSGQDCQAASRVLVESSAYDALHAAVVEQASAVRVGDPGIEDGLEMGPVVSQPQQARVLGFLDRARDEGASIATAGNAPVDQGFFVAPTVVGDVGQAFEITQREVFGPVVTLQRFDDEAEAIRFANGTDYGLSSSVWTGDIGRAMRVSSELQCGTVWINSHFASSPEMPHGGFKQSGFGKDYSKYALEQNTVVKHVAISHG